MATFRQKYDALPERSQRAIDWARSNYHRKWRKRHAQTRSEYRELCAGKPWMKLWWYDHPFGDRELNRKHRLVAYLVQNGRI